MCQAWSFLDKEFLSYPFRKVLDTNMNFDLDLMTWISLGNNIASRAIYLIRFEASGANCSSNLLCYLLHNATAYGHTDTHTNRPTNQPTDKNVQSNMPSFFERGLG